MGIILKCARTSRVGTARKDLWIVFLLVLDDTKHKDGITWHPIDGDSFVEMFLAQCQSAADAVKTGGEDSKCFTNSQKGEDHLPVWPYLVDTCVYIADIFVFFSTFWCFRLLASTCCIAAVVVAAAIADRQSVDSTDEKSSGMFCPWGWSCLASKMSLYPNSFKLLLLLLLLVFLNFQAMCCGNKKENITSEATRFSFSSRTNDYTAGILLSAEKIPATFLYQFFDLGVKTITKK